MRRIVSRKILRNLSPFLFAIRITKPYGILRLGSLKRNLDTYDIPSDGIVVYGEDPNNNMDNFIYGYARIKPYRFGLYTSSNTGDSYKFLCDLQTDDFYLKDNDDNYAFKITRTPPLMNVYGNIISSDIYANNGYFNNISQSTTTLQSNLTSETTTRIYQDNLIAQATSYLETNRVSKLIAGATNVILSPISGQGDVTITLIGEGGGGGDMFRAIDGVNIYNSTNTLQSQINSISNIGSYWVSPATSSLNMANYGILQSSYVYISTGSGQGYYQISDKYIVISGTMSADIQRGINALGVGGGTVELLASTYTINTQINIFKNNVTIKGHGLSTVLLANTWATWTAAGHVFYSSGTSGLTISNLKIDGLAANTGQAKDLINIQRSQYLTFTNLWLDYSDQHGMYIEGSNFVFVNNNVITSCDLKAVYFYGYDNIGGAYSGGYQTIATNNLIRGCATGFTVQYCRAVELNGNYIYGATSWGIESDQLNYGFAIVGNVVFGGTGGGIYFYGTTTNGFNCTGNTISSANLGILVQGDISAGSLTNNSITVTGANNGIEIGSYNLVSGINVIGNTVSIAGGTGKAGINAFVMSNSVIAFNNLTNAAAQVSCGFLLQAGTGNVITSNLAKNHTTDYQLNAFCYDNKLLNNIASDAIKIRDLARDSSLGVAQDMKWGFMRSSPTYTVDVAGTMWVGTTTVSGSSFEKDGTLVFNGEATVFDDLYVELNPATAVYAPAYVNYKSGRVLAFSDEAVNEDRIHFVTQMPHGYKIGSSVYPHLHWVGEDNTAGAVAWKLDYTTATVNGVFNVTTTTTTYVQNSATTDLHNITSLGTITGDRGLSGVILGTLYRNSTNALDTYNGKSVYLMQMDIHYEIDTVGSRQDLTK